MKRRKLGATNRDLGLHGAATPKLGYSPKYSENFDEIFRRPERVLKSPPVVLVDSGDDDLVFEKK